MPTKTDQSADTLSRLGGEQTQLLRGVLDASPDCIKIIELDGRLSFMNENGICAMEIDRFDLVAGMRWYSLWPEENQDRVLAAIRAAKRGERDRFEAYCPTAKGDPRWWDVSVAPVPGPDGRPERIVSISRDVTDRVQRTMEIERHEKELERLALAQAQTLQDKEELLREKDLLMKEVDHRVKNSLALVKSILNVQSRSATDDSAKAAIQQASQRVGTIAAVHERLYRGNQTGTLDVASYLALLCADLEKSVGEGLGIKVDVACEAMEMDVERVTVIGLIVSELVTNSIRHAFGGDAGQITVALTCEAADGFTLSISDNGRGLPDGFDPTVGQGLGMRVIQSYTRKYGWRLEAVNDGGACFRVIA